MIPDWLNLPAAVLCVLLLWTISIVAQAQKRQDFDWGEALRDEGGKLSGLRFAIFVSLVISSWALVAAILTVKTAADFEHLFNWYLAYLAIWSGAKVAEKAIDLIAARLKT